MLKLLAALFALILGSFTWVGFQAYSHSHGGDCASCGISQAVPGPVAGAGLPVIIASGVYLWVRRRRRKMDS